MNDVEKLKEILESMPYPPEMPHSDRQKAGKIKYISQLAQEYGNIDETIRFIEESNSETVMDIFEELLDSDLYKD